MIQLFFLMMLGGGQHALPGEAFTLQPGQQMHIGESGPLFLFLSVDEDSRCPEGSKCMWAGEAKVTVSFDGKMTQLTLAGMGGEPKIEPSGSWELTLVKLDPYPGSDEGESGVKTATFTVHKN